MFISMFSRVIIMTLWRYLLVTFWLDYNKNVLSLSLLACPRFRVAESPSFLFFRTQFLIIVILIVPFLLSRCFCNRIPQTAGTDWEIFHAFDWDANCDESLRHVFQFLFYNHHLWVVICDFFCFLTLFEIFFNSIHMSFT